MGGFDFENENKLLRFKRTFKLEGKMGFSRTKRVTLKTKILLRIFGIKLIIIKVCIKILGSR